MAVIDQTTCDDYVLYNGDCIETMQTLPDESMHLSIYSPPFATDSGGALYNYSSSERDLSNCRTYQEFFDHYEFVVEQIHRLTLPGRQSAVHCMDVPRGCQKGYLDFPGDIIRLHEKIGFVFWCRHFIWKEPFAVRLRTMARGLAHKQAVDDSTLCDVAGADCLLIFRKKGDNPIPVTHETGFEEYAGEREVPHELLSYKNYVGKQRDNIYSHWIWRQYASAFWDDIRLKEVLKYEEGRDKDDERHVHPLQLDVINRVVEMRSNPGENVLTPFMGVGSEVYGAVVNGRRGIGIELKPSYYRQAVKNLPLAIEKRAEREVLLPGFE